MKDINIVIDSQTHKVQFPDNFLGLNAENLQGNINFTFTNGFVNGIARLELSIDCESGFIPNLQNTGDSYTLPILSSLLTSDNIVMQLVIEQTDLITYKLTTDTSINNQKTYYTRSGVEGEYVYTIVENPKVADIGTYYEAQIPIFKTHIFNMTVGESINAVNTIPDDYPTWIDTLNSLVGQVNAKIIEMNQALAEVDNLDITATKEGTTVTITITRKDGSQQVVTLTDGKDGVGIVKIEKTGTNLLVDTYTIYYTDDSTSTFQVKNGRGIVSIDKTDTNILTDTYTITYNDNTTSTFYVVNGNGVESIVKIGTSGLIDIYRISYTNGEYYDYQVANGNGIDNIQKTDTTGLVDTYTITYTNGNTSTYTITNGNGISNIVKTSTVDNIDTYTIYYTNGTTSTFTVTNSTVTNQEFQELQRLVDYNALYANALIKMNNTGTDLTINDTAEAPMPMTLSPSALSQYTTTGKNLLNVVGTKSENGITSTGTSDGKIVSTGTTTATYFTITNNTSIDLPTGTYTFSIDKALPYGIKLRLYDENVSMINNYTIATGNTSITFTTTRVAKLWRIYAEGNLSSGISINTTFYPMLESGSTATDYEPYTGGIPAPNPDYPQDIHTISGDNTIKVANSDNTQEQSLPLNLPVENLLDRTNCEENKILAWATGNLTNDTNALVSDYIKISINENYTFNYKCAVFFYDTNKDYLGCLQSDGSTIAKSTGVSFYSITIPNNNSIVYMRLSFRSSYNDGTNMTSVNIMVNKGTKANSYTPYGTTPLEYSKIGDYEDEFVIPSGKNKVVPFDYSRTNNGLEFIYGIDGSLKVSGTSTGTAYAIANNLVPIYTKLSAGTYILSGATTDIPLRFDDKNGNNIINTTSSNEFTLAEETEGFIQVRIGSGKTINATVYPMIRLSNITDNTYEPYNNGKWYLKKNIGKMVLNGSESGWGDRPSYTYADRFVKDNVFPTTDKSMLSNYFTVSLTTSGTYPYLTNSGKQCVINFSAKGTTSLAQFKEWLSTHNTIVYYALATPEYILLSDTLQSQLTEIYKWVKAYQEQTNISQVNNDLPFIINTITCYDLNKLLTRVEVLESEV